MSPYKVSACKNIIIIFITFLVPSEFLVAQGPAGPGDTCKSCGNCITSQYGPVDATPCGTIMIWSGDVNHSNTLTLGDISTLGAYYNLHDHIPDCHDNYDVNGDGVIDINDGNYLTTFLFIDCLNGPVQGQVCNRKPLTPGKPTGITPACNSTVITRSGPPPANAIWYWQGTTCGTSRADSSANYTVTLSGTYYIRARMTGVPSICWSNKCDSINVIIINPPVAPIFASSNPSSYCVGDTGNITLSITGGSGDTVRWFTGSCGGTAIDTGRSLTIPKPVTTTTYYARWENLCGSSSCASVTVTVNPLPTANAGLDQTICEGKNATLTATGGGTYSWSSGDNTQTTTVSPATNTTYTVTVTLTTGCSDTDSLIVTVNPVPTADAGLSKTICDGDSILLIANGGGTYLWNSNETTDSIIVFPNTTTTYTVTITNGFNCTDTDSLVVTVNPLPIANAGTDTSICKGSSVTLEATGGTSYAWSTNETTDTITVSPTLITTYTVTVTDGNNCSNTDEVFVSMGASLPINAGLDTSLCVGDSITLIVSGAGTGGNYVWNTGDSTSTIWVIPVTTTTYTVTATDSTGCSGTDDIVVTVNILPTANAGANDSICYKDTISLTATGGVSYKWSTSETTVLITVSPAMITTYTVTVTDNNGCTDTDDILIVVKPLPTANIGADDTICRGKSKTLIASGGTSYKWSTTQTANFITVSPTTTTTYTLTVTNFYECTASDEMVIYVNPLPPANAGSDIAICNEITDTLTASGGGTYLWNTTDTCSSITINPNTTTTYTVTVTNSYGCTASDEVIVTVNLLPTADAGTDFTICYGKTDTLTANGGTSYVWSNSYTTNQITVSPIVTTTYIVTVTDINGCSDIDTVIVTVNSLPTADAGKDTAICNGDTITLIASGGGTLYEWNTGETTNTITINPSVTMIYTVTVTDTNGCSNTDEVIVTVNPLPSAPDVTDLLVCRYDETTLIINNPISNYTYQWYDSIAGGNLLYTGTSYHVPNVENATYYVEYIDSNGCKSTRVPITILWGIHPVANFTVDDTPPFYEKQLIQFIDQSSNADNWHWTFGDGETSTDKNPEHPYSTEGIYSVMLIVCTSINPYCCDTITKTDYISILKRTDVYVPGAFTPNNDNKNDVLKVLGENIIKLDFKIYNQWGLLIFETNNQQIGWDGTYQDNPQPESNYIYVLEAHIGDGRIIAKQGVVSLIR